jgi:deazaflavin-dependent oxidoreductase (nitroreductase family)
VLLRAAVALRTPTFAQGARLEAIPMMTDTDFTSALPSTKELELTTTGRTSGLAISHPVWFVQQGETLYLLPVGGADSQWYKNVLKTPTIRLAAGKTKHSARATPITDPAKVQEVVERFRTKYGARDVQAYFPKREVAVEVVPV